MRNPLPALPRGTWLPSVRALAEVTGSRRCRRAGFSRHLCDAGLVETRAGLGAFTVRAARHLRADGVRTAALGAEIGAPVARAERLGAGGLR
jgi:DNA-binding transcriptional regulator YhcF (GntR family)